MTHPPQVPTLPSIPIGSGTVTMFILSPLFVAFGWFLWAIQHSRSFDWAIVQTAVGVALFWLGVIMFFTACLLVGIRNIAIRQQVNLIAAAQLTAEAYQQRP